MRRNLIFFGLILSTALVSQKILAQCVVTTLAGSFRAGFADGTGAAAQFSSPEGVTTDSAGNVYVGDRNNHRIRKLAAGCMASHGPFLPPISNDPQTRYARNDTNRNQQLDFNEDERIIIHQ